MPYIKPERRDDLSGKGGEEWDNPGELNYALTCGIMQYVEHKGLSYQTINDVIGALEGAKLEFYRRVAVPYENTKIELNGDVYPATLTGEPDAGPSTVR